MDTQGDAFFVAFAGAGGAAAAAEEAIDALSDGPVRVRIGVHTGEPIVRDGSYVGVDVHRAARVMSVAHGGQVVASQATRELLDADRTRDLGVHRLKDVGELRLFQLGEGSFPPLRSLNNTNLPARLEPLLGRKRELSDLLRLVRVDQARVVTLTGPGGVGKTRLALELAARARDATSSTASGSSTFRRFATPRSYSRRSPGRSARGRRSSSTSPTASCCSSSTTSSR